MSTLHPMDHVDTAFFSVDTDAMPQTVAAVCILDRLPNWGTVQSRVSVALDSFPRLKEKVVRRPCLAWQEDPSFDLSHHFQTVHSPNITDRNDLLVEASRVVNQRLDMTRPPWRLVLVTDGGNQSCIVICLHHGAADGVRLVRLLDTISSDSPSSSKAAAVDAEQLSPAEPKRWMETLSYVLRCSQKLISESFVPCAASPLNGPTLCQRSIWPLDLPRRELAQIMRQVDGSLHDVLYTVVAGALRLYHQERGRPMKNLRAIVPMAVPPRSNKGGLGNHLVLSVLTLPVSEPDPLNRLTQVRDAFGRMKADGTIAAYEFAAMVIHRFVPRALHRAIWDSMLRKTNTVCTVLSGPASVRYLGGARIDGLYGVPAPVARHGVALAFVSYGGKICGTIVTDNVVVPAGRELVDCLSKSYGDLLSESIGDAGPVHPLLGRMVPSPGYDSIFEETIRAQTTPCAGQYSLGDCAVLPAGSLLEMILAAAATAGARPPNEGPLVPEDAASPSADGISQIVLEEVFLRRPLAYPKQSSRTVQTAMIWQDSSWQIRVSSLQEDDTWAACAEATARPGTSPPAAPDLRIAEVRQTCSQMVPVAGFYRWCQERRIHYGVEWQVLRQLWQGENEALGLVELPDSAHDTRDFRIHPALLEASLQVAMTAISSWTTGQAVWTDGATRIRVVEVSEPLVWVHATFRRESQGVTASAGLFTREGQCAVWMEGLRWSIRTESLGFEGSVGELDFLQRVKKSHHSQRRKLVMIHVRTQVASILGYSTAAQVRQRDRLIDLGIDSMMAIELSVRLQTSTMLSLPQTLAFDYPTVESLTNYLCERLQSDADLRPSTSRITDAAPEDLSSLSESELADLLFKELD